MPSEFGRSAHYSNSAAIYQIKPPPVRLERASHANAPILQPAMARPIRRNPVVRLRRSGHLTYVRQIRRPSSLAHFERLSDPIPRFGE